MKPHSPFHTALALLLLATASGANAQSNQIGAPVNSAANGIYGSYLTIYGNAGPACGINNYRFTVAPTSQSWGTGHGAVATYYSLPAGKGDQTFSVAFGYSADYAVPTPTYSVFIDGVYCSTCTAVVGSHSQDFFGNYQDYVTITHQAGDAWSEPNDGIREFGLRMNPPGFASTDIRFKAVMVGTVISERLGSYDAPALPLYVLHDPPGSDSYSKLTVANSGCTGMTNSVTTGDEASGYFKARVGVEGSFGFGVEIDYEIFVEAGVSLSASQSETSAFEYQTCVETSSEFNTPTSGTPDDMFILSGVRYDYGVGKVIERPTCGEVVKTAYLASVPISVNNSYHWTESYLRGTKLPQLQQQLTTLTPGTMVYEKAAEQISVYQQVLAMNDSIKANAPFVTNEDIVGGNSGIDHTYSRTTSITRKIDYKVNLEAGLSLEFGVKIGGSGVSGGAAIKMRTEYGSGQSSTNTTTNTVNYHLEDGDPFDYLNIIKGRDDVFGNFTFALDSSVSRTSCKYEGGYQLDQPSLSVGTPGNTSMTLNELTIGQPASFPIIVCNNSDIERSYYLKFDNLTNGGNAVLQVFGTTINGNDLGHFLQFQPGQCVTGTLTLTPTDQSIVDYDDISLYMYSRCEEDPQYPTGYPPFIRSYATISAHYGTGNFGSYCIPVSSTGTAGGDYIDGVRLGAISNTGTGGVGGPSYTDYSAQYSTPLSRNAPRLITITAGSRVGGRYSAWIDYDHNGTFDIDEKLGGFNSATAGEAQDIAFTVPASALLGSTILRVRGAFPQNGEPGLLGPCFNYMAAETEDYAVVINSNTPQDCQGVNNGPAMPGTPCNDGNASTGNDAWNANCQCVGESVDCLGVAGGTALPGTPCDDGNGNTIDDVYTADCQCVGVTYDCLGIAGGPALPGTPCNDGNPSTGGDQYNLNCDCVGILIDCAGVIGGTTLPGTPCDDGNPLSGGDAFNASCQCVGAFAVDCMGVENGPAQPGTPCDDGNPQTGDDTYSTSCVCAGQPYDCAGTPGGSALPGSPCNDGNPNTSNDVYGANCQCAGTVANDCLGVPGGTAQPSTPCDDGDPDTGNDQYNASCQCVGQPLDCLGVAGGGALPGFPCNDNDPMTGNDQWTAACDCAGLPFDCAGIAGGGSLPGTPCDDGDPDTENDAYTANCQCAGTLAQDCLGVPGGTAQPGTPCDDGDASTGNDTFNANCECAGVLIDCNGSIGGTALPGSTCNDGDACTTNDHWDAACGCTGTPLAIGVVNGPGSVDAEGFITLYINPVAGATSYSWNLPQGWTSTSTAEFVLVATAGTATGPVQVCVDATVGGCVLTNCQEVNVMGPQSVATANLADTWFTVQPNPTNGVFQVVVADPNDTIRLTVYDGTGRIVRAPFLLAGRTATMDLGDVASGAYYVLAERDGQQYMVKLMVQR
ncbi:MAG: T9SS type A sorting domain-containing protein [Flavobacteriales bacterium]|nr:T9SS type A sorting domain-containing protein [Flavobacteriales bacterium]